MTLHPRGSEDLSTAEGIISRLGAILNGTATLDELDFPNNGKSIVDGIEPSQARKILSDAGISE